MPIIIVRDQDAPMKHVVHVRNHSFAVDEAPSNGGEDAGPDPHDLFDAALGACKALTVLWYAKKKGIPVADIAVEVARDAVSDHAQVYRLRSELRLGGPLSEAQKRELLSVAGKCPVHKLMTLATIEIETVLKP